MFPKNPDRVEEVQEVLRVSLATGTWEHIYSHNAPYPNVLFWAIYEISEYTFRIVQDRIGKDVSSA